MQRNSACTLTCQVINSAARPVHNFGRICIQRQCLVLWAVLVVGVLVMMWRESTSSNDDWPGTGSYLLKALLFPQPLLMWPWLMVLMLGSCLMIVYVLLGSRFLCSSTRLLRSQRCSEATCAICLEDLTAQTRECRLPCGHTFHQACVNEWLCRSARCPFRCEGQVRASSAHSEWCMRGESQHVGKDAFDYAACSERRTAAAEALASAFGPCRSSGLHSRRRRWDDDYDTGVGRC